MQNTRWPYQNRAGFHGLKTELGANRGGFTASDEQ